MMRYESLLLFSLLCAFLCALNLYSEERPGCAIDAADAIEVEYVSEEVPVNYDNTVFKKQVRSILPGVIVGAITGTLCAKMVHHHQALPMTLLLWICESALRNSILNGLAADYKENDLAFHKNVLSNMGWVVSWLAYCRERGIHLA